MQQTILSIAGKPGLYKLLSRGNRNLIFAEVLPNYDRDRVHNSDIKKLLQWYNILIENGITDFETEMKPTEGDNIDDRKDME